MDVKGYTYNEFIKEYIESNFYKDNIINNIENTDHIENIKKDISYSIICIHNVTNKSEIYMIDSIINSIVNDIMINHNKVNKLKNIVDELLKLELPEQRSKEWFELRKGLLTASSLASALGHCFFKSRDELILDKSDPVEKPYESNDITEWGVKYEEIATKFYELINNVKILEFGLIPHPNFKIFGASPDGICSNESPDNYIGRMLEIKCPPKRKFTKTVPGHYGFQMQGQLECCNLEECDFLQVKLLEYDNINDYINDKFIYENNIKEGYTANDLPKGCTVTYQKNNSLSYNYLYPELELSYDNYVKWINEQKNWIINNNHKFIESKWWKIERYECTLVKRDRNWWLRTMEEIQKFWEEVEYYKINDKTDIINRINNSKKRKFKKEPDEIITTDKCLL